MKALSYFRRIPKLGYVPKEDLTRKFLVLGQPQSGKTRVIQNLYDQFTKIEYEQSMYKWTSKSESGNKSLESFKFASKNAPDQPLEKPTDQLTVSGFKTGDIRAFEFQKAMKAQFSTSKSGNPAYLQNLKFSNFFKNSTPKPGLMTLDGQQWALSEDQDQFQEILEQEINKEADVYLFDSISECIFSSGKQQDRLIEIMKDTNKVLIGSIFPREPGQKFGIGDHLQ